MTTGRGTGRIETIACLLHIIWQFAQILWRRISRLRSRLHAGILYIYHRYGPLAQSREQRICNSKVAGWNPAWSTKSDTGRLLDSGRPVFRTVPLLPAPRAASRAAGRGVHADCLPRNRSAAHDMAQSVHLPRDDTSRRAVPHAICRHSRIFPFNGKPAFSYHITMKAASRPTPSIATRGAERDYRRLLANPSRFHTVCRRGSSYSTSRQSDREEPICAFSV